MMKGIIVIGVCGVGAVCMAHEVIHDESIIIIDTKEEIQSKPLAIEAIIRFEPMESNIESEKQVHNFLTIEPKQITRTVMEWFEPGAT